MLRCCLTLAGLETQDRLPLEGRIAFLVGRQTSIFNLDTWDLLWLQTSHASGLCMQASSSQPGKGKSLSTARLLPALAELAEGWLHCCSNLIERTHHSRTQYLVLGTSALPPLQCCTPWQSQKKK